MNKIDEFIKFPLRCGVFLFVLASFLHACHSTKEGEIADQESQKIDIDLDAKRTIYMSELFEDIRYLKLENVEERLIGNIQKTLIRDDIIFIFEKTTPSIFLYDLSGNYLNQIVIPKGRGPEEMIATTDFSVNVDKKQVVVLGFLETHTYTFEGKFVRRQSLNINPTRFSVLSNELNAFFMDNRTYSNMKIKNIGYNLLYSGGSGYTKFLSIPKYKANLSLRGTNNFTQYNEKQLLYFHPSYKIYELKPDRVSVRYILNFGKYNVPQSLFEQRKNLNEGANFIQKTIKGEYASFLVDFLETDPLIYFSIFWDRQEAYKVFYSKKQNKSFVSEKLVNDIDGGPIPNFATTYNNELISHIQPADVLKKVHELKRSKDSLNKYKQALIKFAEDLKPLDNPVIMFAKVK